MRTILVILAFVIFFVVTLPVYLILLLVRLFHPKLCSKIAQFFVRYGFRFIMFFTGTRTVVLGKDRVPRDQPVLYVSNHRSLLDTPIAYSQIPTLTGFVSKIEIKKVPFLSWWMRLLNCIFLDRSDMRAGVKMVLDGIENIKNGYSMHIAPEGTRTHEKEPQAFKEGALKMADKTGCPIVPIAISGTDDMLENNWPWIRKCATVIEFGEPIYPNELTKEERKFLGAYSREKIIKMLEGHEAYVANNPSRKNK